MGLPSQPMGSLSGLYTKSSSSSLLMAAASCAHIQTGQDLCPIQPVEPVSYLAW